LHNIEGTNGVIDSSTTYKKDALERLIRVETPIGANANYLYDSQDRLIKVDLNGQIRKFTYDSLGFLRQSRNPENGSVIINEYDVWGNIVKYQDENGLSSNYKIKNSYDNKGRIIKREKVDSGTNTIIKVLKRMGI